MELILYIAVLFILSVGLYAYVAWHISAKRRAMRFITINERQTLVKASLTATVFLSISFITLTIMLLNSF
ncbi:MAG TPA: hypothetical protein GXX29_05235 [Firmicutes bacterium]|nr:hypothetical protein [Bacillota bacterium]